MICSNFAFTPMLGGFRLVCALLLAEISEMKRSLLFAILLAVSLASPALAEKRIALVIGNSAYQNVAPLDNPANDATLMAQTLKDLGFSLTGGSAQLNLTKPALDDAVQEFGRQVQGADVALFYYAGHGVQVRGSNFLVPVNANPTREADVDFQMVDVNVVLNQMQASGTRLNMIILDACRNNPFGGRGLRSSAGGLAQIRAPDGTLISYATQPGNVAQDGSDGHSPYTRALAATMKRPGLDVFQTFNEVGLSVKRTTGGAQQPWVSSSPIDGSFYFTGPPSAMSAATPRAPPVDAAAQAWAVTRDTTSQAVLEDFMRQFGNTVYASMARARLEELKKAQVATLPPQQKEIEQQELGRSLQLELKRVGCYEGAVNGEFGNATREALRNFVKYSALTLRNDNLSLDAIKAVRSFDKRVCPLSCQAGERAEGDACIRVTASPARPPSGAKKCFSFQGREFCE
jgi:uncharacterized caspase-like protein